MRINRSVILKIIDDTVAQRTRAERGILSIFLCGSLLGEEYLLGGATDIDLVFVHLDAPSVAREIVRLTDDVHLDIAHYSQKALQNTRNLRLHPWLGPTIFDCKIVYDPLHFMDFTQASVRGQFNREDYVAQRSRQRLESARQIWMGFATAEHIGPGPAELLRYLQAIEHAANAVASLAGPPLTERRLLLNFHARAEALGRPGLHSALLAMLGAPHVDQDAYPIWVESWQAAYQAVPADALPPRLHPDRRLYYRHAFNALLQDGPVNALLWPLLRTWTMAAAQLPIEHPAQTVWRQAVQYLGLQGEGFAERVAALDAFLDTVEELLDRWLQERGG